MNRQKGNSALFRGHGFFSRMCQYGFRRNEASAVSIDLIIGINPNSRKKGGNEHNYAAGTHFAADN